jgi:hypothetical protein
MLKTLILPILSIIFSSCWCIRESQNSNPYHLLPFNNSNHTHLQDLVNVHFDEISKSMHGAIVDWKGQIYKFMYSSASKEAVFWRMDSGKYCDMFWKTRSQSSSLVFENLNKQIRNNIDIKVVVARKPKDNVPLREMLIVLTTCNQLKMTLLALDYIKSAMRHADVLIVDDASTDGTVDYLVKKGYSVISKNAASGLTSSWNIGFGIAAGLGYKFVLFMNNDVLINEHGAEFLKITLRREVLMVPLTTNQGAGHNPTQVQQLLTRIFDSLYMNRCF